PVLWIDEDSGERRIKRRLGDVARGYDAGENTPFQVLSLAGIDVLDNQSAANFERLIRNQGAKLVVVDTLADIIGGAKVISPDEMQPVLQCLRRIAERTGALIIFIHHTNKAGDFLGAINIAGKADLLLQVDSATDSPIIKFESTKARDTGAANFAAKACFYPDSARFWLEPVDIDGLNQAKRISTMSGANKYVYEFIQQNGVSEIEDMIDEELHKRATIEKAVSRLCDDKMIRRVNEGGRGVKGQYAIL
ncbi:MAG: AAA family ATPase, partial [Chloroflexota bacterium]